MPLIRFLATALLACFLSLPLRAETVSPPPPSASPPAAGPLKVGVLLAPPFAFHDHDLQWTGLCVELWRHIATALKIDYELVPAEMPTVYADLAAGKFDVALGGLTPDSQNIMLTGFTLPYMPSGLAIAVRPDTRPGFLDALIQMDTSGVFSFLGLIIVCLMVVAILVWWLERRRNPEHFGGSPLTGLGQSFWWSAVTMTTVGYGDLVPRSTSGRILAFGWMILSLILVSVFTGLVTSAMTVSQMSAGITGPGDLQHVSVGAITDSDGAAYLDRHNIAYTGYPGSHDALRALAGGEIDAVVSLAPELRFMAQRDFPGQISVLPHLILRRWVSFAIRPGLPQARGIEQQMVRITETDMWNRVLVGFLGRDH